MVSFSFLKWESKDENGTIEKDVTYLIGKERAEGNQEELTAEYISRVLGADLNDVREALKEINE